MGRPLMVLACLVFAAAVAAALVGCAKGEYVGSRISNKYHTRDCVWAEEMKRENRVWFETAEEARTAGYVACPNCLPGQ